MLHKALPWVLEDCHISRNTNWQGSG